MSTCTSLSAANKKVHISGTDECYTDGHADIRIKSAALAYQHALQRAPAAFVMWPANEGTTISRMMNLPWSCPWRHMSVKLRTSWSYLTRQHRLVQTVSKRPKVHLLVEDKDGGADPFWTIFTVSIWYQRSRLEYLFFFCHLAFLITMSLDIYRWRVGWFLFTSSKFHTYGIYVLVRKRSK